MQRLVTPTQYELVLDELNALRPLRLRDKVSTLLNIPVVDKHDIDNKRICEGVALRCIQQGSLLSRNVFALTGVETKSFPHPLGHGGINHVWTQRVYGVLVYVYGLKEPVTKAVWANMNNDTILDFESLGCHWCSFVGTKFRTYVGIGPSGYCDFNLYGFY